MRGVRSLIVLLVIAVPLGWYAYRESLKAHGAEVIPNEFAGGYNLRSELLWNLEAKYHTLPISDRMAWEAASPFPSTPAIPRARSCR